MNNMIRKSIINSFYVSLAVAMLASCNASDEAFPSLADGTRAVTVEMQVGVSGGVASRELTMWDGAQQVNDMRIYVFRCEKEKKGTAEETFTYYIPEDLKRQNKTYYTVTDFDNKEPYYSYKHGNKPQQYTYDLKTYLPKGYYYQFLAVGRDDKYVDKAERSLEEVSFEEGTTALQDAKMALTKAAVSNARMGTFKCTEFFSGHLNNDNTKEETPILIEEGSEHFNSILTATRNVAGVMMYVENIPAFVDDNTQDTTTPVSFTPTSLSIEVTGIEGATLIDKKTAPDVATDLVDKGEGKKGYLTLGVIYLSAANGWTKDDNKKIFTRPAEEAKGWLENSYMVSNFVMPTPESYMGESKNFDKSKVTFMLHYTDGTHHRYDNIKDQNSDRILFPIEANHIYSMGMKTSQANDPFDLLKNYQPVIMDMKIDLEPAFVKRHDFETE